MTPQFLALWITLATITAAPTRKSTSSNSHKRLSELEQAAVPAFGALSAREKEVSSEDTKYVENRLRKSAGKTNGRPKTSTVSSTSGEEDGFTPGVASKEGMSV